MSGRIGSGAAQLACEVPTSEQGGEATSRPAPLVCAAEPKHSVEAMDASGAEAVRSMLATAARGAASAGGPVFSAAMLLVEAKRWLSADGAQEGAPAAPEPVASTPGPAQPAAPTALQGPVLKLGAYSEASRLLQVALHEAGEDPGTPAKTFGNRTDRALRAFQKKHGLPETGQTDAKTWAALLEAAPKALKGGVPKEAAQDPRFIPGAPVKPAPEQARRTLEHALVVPEEERKELVQLDVAHKPQKGKTDCRDTALAMVATALGVPHVEDRQKKRHHVATGEDTHGRVQMDATKLRTAMADIDAELDAGRPVVAGVSHTAGLTYNDDELTDHFVTIVGRGYDDDGRLYYSFHDPGLRDGANLRFYVDQASGKLFKVGASATAHGVGGDYEVTQLRSYIPPKEQQS